MFKKVICYFVTFNIIFALPQSHFDIVSLK